jgi:hypothetical protein
MSTGGMPVTLQYGEVTQYELASCLIQRLYGLDYGQRLGRAKGVSLFYDE